MKLPYSEGSVFLVPLKDGGYARGVVARISPDGKVLLGYFFGPRLVSNTAVAMNDLRSTDARLRIRFGDLGLINGAWVVCGEIPNWNRSEWPFPDFLRRDPLGKLKPVQVRYFDMDPLRVESERFVDDDPGLATNSLYGYEAVEIELNKLLR